MASHDRRRKRGLVGRKRANETERREFLKQAGLAAGGLLGAGGTSTARLGEPIAVSIVLDASQMLASASPARWAAEHLRQSLGARGMPSRLAARIGDVPAGDLVVL